MIMGELPVIDVEAAAAAVRVCCHTIPDGLIAEFLKKIAKLTDTQAMGVLRLLPLLRIDW